MNKKLSVIVTNYNNANFVEDSLDSLRLQTLDKQYFEVLFVDDCSTDDTYSMARTINNEVGNFPISFYRNTSNKGVSFSRNFGADNASCDILFYLDGDDMLHEKCLEECLNMYDDPSVGFVYSNHSSVEPDATFKTKEDSVIKVTEKNEVFNIENYILGRKNWVGHFKSVRKNNFIEFRDLPYAEDADWVLNLGLNGVGFGHIPESLYYWRRGIDSISSRMKNEASGWHNKVFDNAKIKLEQIVK